MNTSARTVVFAGTAPLLVLLSLWWRSGKTFYKVDVAT
jgi:hypothetical protein